MIPARDYLWQPAKALALGLFVQAVAAGCPSTASVLCREEALTAFAGGGGPHTALDMPTCGPCLTTYQQSIGFPKTQS